MVTVPPGATTEGAAVTLAMTGAVGVGVRLRVTEAVLPALTVTVCETGAQPLRVATTVTDPAGTFANVNVPPAPVRYDAPGMETIEVASLDPCTVTVPATDPVELQAPHSMNNGTTTDEIVRRFIPALRMAAPMSWLKGDFLLEGTAGRTQAPYRLEARIRR
jgi:hypothetical protein